LKTLSKNSNPFSKGDSAPEDVAAVDVTLRALKAYRTSETPFTLILDDPFSNSYIQEFEDTAGWLIIEDYTRTEKQNEHLGINDMRTEPMETEHGIDSRLPQSKGHRTVTFSNWRPFTFDVSRFANGAAYNSQPH
jgi:hypothetical protein